MFENCSTCAWEGCKGRPEQEDPPCNIVLSQFLIDGPSREEVDKELREKGWLT